MLQERSRSADVVAWVVPIVIAAAALVVGSIVPIVSPLLLALLAGAVIANVTEVPGSVADGTRLALRLGVALLGLRLSLGDLGQIGVSGVVVVLATVATTYAATLWIGSRLGVERDVVTLVAVGFSICGAAAIAGVQEAVRARREAVVLAVAMVTVFGSIMIGLVPLMSALFGLSDDQRAVWIGASIHEVAQVVAAASIAAPLAVALATSVKLGRVALLAPIHVLASRRAPRSAGAPLVPWFLVGFLVAVGVQTADVLGERPLHLLGDTATFLLAVGMVGLGVGVRVKDLLPVPWPAVGLSAASTFVAATTSGLLTVALVG